MASIAVEGKYLDDNVKKEVKEEPEDECNEQTLSYESLPVEERAKIEKIDDMPLLLMEASEPSTSSAPARRTYKAPPKKSQLIEEFWDYLILDDNIYQCPVCTSFLESAIEVSDHLANVHSNVQPKLKGRSQYMKRPFSCSACNISFMNVYQLINHWKVLKDSGQPCRGNVEILTCREYSCNSGSNAYTRSGFSKQLPVPDADTGLMSGGPIKPFPVSWKRRPYAQQAPSAPIIVTLTGTMKKILSPVHCPKCKVWQMSYSCLMDHVKEHSTNNGWHVCLKCTGCGCLFASLRELRNHLILQLQLERRVCYNTAAVTMTRYPVHRNQHEEGEESTSESTAAEPPTTVAKEPPLAAPNQRTVRIVRRTISNRPQILPKHF